MSMSDMENIVIRMVARTYIAKEILPVALQRFKEEQMADAQIKEQQMIDAQIKEQQRIDAQIKEQQRIDAQIKEQQRIDAQIKEQQMIDAQIKKRQRIDAQIKEQKMADAQIIEQQRVNAQIKEQQRPRKDKGRRKTVTKKIETTRKSALNKELNAVENKSKMAKLMGALWWCCICTNGDD